MSRMNRISAVIERCQTGVADELLAPGEKHREAVEHVGE
jgi:hypothetical protein